MLIHFSDLSITVILNLQVFSWFMEVKVPHSTLKLKYLMWSIYDQAHSRKQDFLIKSVGTRKIQFTTTSLTFVTSALSSSSVWIGHKKLKAG